MAYWDALISTSVVATIATKTPRCQLSTTLSFVSRAIEGTQGRHFHPLFFVLPWILYSRRWSQASWTRWTGRLVVGFTVLSLSVATVALIERYYPG